MNDPFDLQRFVKAQDPVFDEVCAELRAGQKRSHWMWFIFPQLSGLGHSATAQKFAICSRQEAQAYLQHSTLGPRLRQCAQLVSAVEGRSIEQIFGFPDDLKFHSSMTLFAATAADAGTFNEALRKYFSGEPDVKTLAML